MKEKLSPLCPKCGSLDTTYQYRTTTDEIQRHCKRCGYDWAVQPLVKRKGS